MLHVQNHSEILKVNPGGMDCVTNAGKKTDESDIIHLKLILD